MYRHGYEPPCRPFPFPARMKKPPPEERPEKLCRGGDYCCTASDAGMV